MYFLYKKLCREPFVSSKKKVVGRTQSADYLTERQDIYLTECFA